MTIGEATKILKDKGFELLNQRGSHLKFGKNGIRITLISHNGSKKELMSTGSVKNLKKALEQLEKI